LQFARVQTERAQDRRCDLHVRHRFVDAAPREPRVIKVVALTNRVSEMRLFMTTSDA
jgi:hypothetical protein